MKPVSPVVNKNLVEVVYAKEQTQYLPLPALRGKDGVVITRWKLSMRERIKIAITGSLWLFQLTFNQIFQPQRPTVDKPVVTKKVE
jgi:hypothetical protein